MPALECNEQKITAIKKEIEKLMKNNEISSDRTTELLQELRRIPMKLAVLEKTRVGMTVNSLRKASGDESISQLSKSLIKSWKKLLNEEAAPESPSAKVARVDSSDNDSNPPTQFKPETEIPTNNQTPKANAVIIKPAASRPVAAPGSIRDKCREMLLTSLKTNITDDLEIFTDLEGLAAQIEEEIFNEYGDSSNSKYKDKIRSRVFNLKDSRNPDLKRRVIIGDITPKRLATMKPEEMASEEMKKLRQKFNEEGINDHQMAMVEGTKTDLITCGKCKKNQCTYSQMQTRSSDEPMTTFVFCNNCGNRWKFC